MILLFSTAKPSVKVKLSLGLCGTLLIDTLNWVAWWIWVLLPLLWVALNFLLTPSKETRKVWDKPVPTDDKLIAVKVAASDWFAASLKVWGESLII